MKRTTLVALTLFLGACAEDVGGIRLGIENDGLVVGEDIDTVVFELVANLNTATDASARTCDPIRRPYPLTGPQQVDFPLAVGVRLGDEDWVCVAVRVTGELDGAPVVHDEGLYCPPSLQSEVSSYPLVLSSQCHGSEAPACAAGEACLGTECRPSRLGSLFEVEPTIDLFCDGSLNPGD